MVDVSTAHAFEHHRAFAPDEETFRRAIRGQIKYLMAQAYMTESEIAESLG